jgi:drug/metabolite transporter (DMT)-like permease
MTVIPLSRWIEGERPTRRSLIGGIIAVVGVAILTTSQ